MVIDTKKIIRNAVKCNKCGQVIESVNPDITIKCSCGNVSIGGGCLQLIREGNDFTEMTEYYLSD